MKRLCIILPILLLLVGCASQQAEEPSAAPSESDTKIPQETLNDINTRLTDFFYGHDNVSIVVLDDGDGAFETSLHAVGMVLQITFPDFANAMVIQSQELAEEYGLSLSEVSITFTAGEEDVMRWSTNDCISGILFDAYNGNEILLKNQSIADLVDRYGAMDWFYPLSSAE